MSAYRKMPRVNPGFTYGQQHTYTIEQAESEWQAENGKLSPHDLGEFRKEFWRSRVLLHVDDLRSCTRYMRTDDMKRLDEQVIALYKTTLIEMYGDAEARRFLLSVHPELVDEGA